MQKIPIFDMTTEIEALWPQLSTAIEEVFRSGCFVLGSRGELFEKKIADYIGVPHAVALNSGTDALLLALKALDIGQGDEVIVPSFTFFATGEMVAAAGAKAVFCDVGLDTFTLDPSHLASLITPRTKAIIPVHLFGHSAAMTEVMRIAQAKKIPVIEDVAQAFGASYDSKKVGSFGELSAFSFYPTKNLGTYGDGGLVATKSEALAQKLRMLRNHGCRKRYHHEFLGYNSRLDEIHAAILLTKLPHVETGNNRRREAATRYRSMLAGMEKITVPTELSNSRHVYHQFTIRIRNGKRDQVNTRLQEKGITTMIYYPIPIHLTPPFMGAEQKLPNTEKLAGEVLSLPMWPDISEEIQGRVVQGLKEALR